MTLRRMSSFRADTYRHTLGGVILAGSAPINGGWLTVPTGGAFVAAFCLLTAGPALLVLTAYNLPALVHAHMTMLFAVSLILNFRSFRLGLFADLDTIFHEAMANVAPRQRWRGVSNPGSASGQGCNFAAHHTAASCAGRMLIAHLPHALGITQIDMLLYC